MLKFPDDTQIKITGLTEILADLYSRGVPANDETAAEIIDRLEAGKNFIPEPDRIRQEYRYVLLKEYREYIKGRDNKPK